MLPSLILLNHAFSPKAKTFDDPVKHFLFFHTKLQRVSSWQRLACHQSGSMYGDTTFLYPLHRDTP